MLLSKGSIVVRTRCYRCPEGCPFSYESDDLMSPSTGPFGPEYRLVKASVLECMYCGTEAEECTKEQMWAARPN